MRIESPFEGIKHISATGKEYWIAREVMFHLGYVKWERFNDSIERAMISCKLASHEPSDHFPEAGNLIKAGKGARLKQKDYHLTRYACYLIAMNGDPRKEQIALAQAYFAVQTHYAESVQAQKALPQPVPFAPVPNHEISARLARTYEFLEPRIPHLYWAIITELHREVRIAELLGKLDGGAFPEISVGLKWAAYARKTLHIDTSDLSTYRHSDPKAKKKKEFPAACYPMSCLQDFRDWFKDIYLPYHCPVYVGNRQKRVAQQVKQLVGASIVYQIEASMK